MQQGNDVQSSNNSKRFKHIGADLNFAASESYKRLRTNIFFSLEDKDDDLGYAIGITSSLRGEGKSTTSINTAYALAESGKHVILLECDMRLPVMAKNLDISSEPGLSDFIVGLCTSEEAIRTSLIHQNLDIVPAGSIPPNPSELLGTKRFKNILKVLKKAYDFVIIDCPPSLNMLTINAMTTADTVLVPIQCEYYALEGLSQLLHTVNLVKQRLNPDLEMEGVVFTMYDARTNLSLQVVENVKSNLHQTIYKTIIPRNIRLAEAPSHGLPINVYDSKSTGAESYRLLAEEVIHRGEEEWQ